MASEIFIILALILANAVFAGAEIALLSVRKSRVKELLESGSKTGAALHILRADPERLLATVQIVTTAMVCTAAVFGGAHIAPDVAVAFERWGLQRRTAHALALVAVVMGVAFLTLVIGELVPKSLALRSAEGYARVVARPLLGLSRLASPLVWLLTRSSNLFLRVFGDSTTFTESRVSTEELRLMVDEAARSGTLDPRAGEIASRALGFGELTAYDVMVPRGAVVSLPITASPQVVKRVLLEENHSRLPVYDGTIDNVVGYVTAKDVLAMMLDQSLIIMADLIRPPYFVPETMPTVVLLQEMQKRRVPLALVVDEGGSTQGIVTLEDVLEELVGEMFNEHDKPATTLYSREADGAIRAQGTLPIREANRELGLRLPEGDTWTTIAGLCIGLAGRIPTTGSSFKAEDGTVLEVVEATARRVRVVRLRPTVKGQTTPA